MMTDEFQGDLPGDFPTRTAAVGAAPIVTSGRRDTEERPNLFRWRYLAHQWQEMTTPVDVSSLLGVPLEQISRPIQEKIAQLAAQIDHLRQELNQSQHHIHWLEEQADQEPLLPVLHRRSFLRELGRMLGHVQQASMPCTVILLHVGGVEALRCRHGLAAGDAALLHMAGLLKAELRQTDLLGYLDNSDFIVALALADDDNASEKASRLLLRLQTAGFVWNGVPVNFDVQAGQAHYRDSDTPQSLLAEADAAMRSP